MEEKQAVAIEKAEELDPEDSGEPSSDRQGREFIITIPLNNQHILNCFIRGGLHGKGAIFAKTTGHPQDDDMVRYVCFQVEEGGKTAYRHIQMFIHFNPPGRAKLSIECVKKFFIQRYKVLFGVGDVDGWTRKQFSPLARILNSMHVEMRRSASRKHARNYCFNSRKAGFLAGPYEFGTYVSDPTVNRTDWTGFKDEVLAGKTDFQLLNRYEHIMIAHPNAAKRIRTIAAAESVPKVRQVMTYLLMGDPGTGKTSFAYAWAEIQKKNVYEKTEEMEKWWEGYDPAQGDILLINDLNTNWIGTHALLNWTDPAGRRGYVQNKGGSTIQAWNVVLITTNLTDYDQWVAMMAESKDGRDFKAAITRRIEKAYVVNSMTEKPKEVGGREKGWRLKGILKAIDKRNEEIIKGRQIRKKDYDKWEDDENGDKSEDEVFQIKREKEGDPFEGLPVMEDDHAASIIMELGDHENQLGTEDDPIVLD